MIPSRLTCRHHGATGARVLGRASRLPSRSHRSCWQGGPLILMLLLPCCHGRIIPAVPHLMSIAWGPRVAGAEQSLLGAATQLSKTWCGVPQSGFRQACHTPVYIMLLWASLRDESCSHPPRPPQLLDMCHLKAKLGCVRHDEYVF